MGYSSRYWEEYRAPKMLNAVGKFFKHLSALSELFKEDEPALSLIQVAVIVEVL